MSCRKKIGPGRGPTPGTLGGSRSGVNARPRRPIADLRDRSPKTPSQGLWYRARQWQPAPAGPRARHGRHLTTHCIGAQRVVPSVLQRPTRTPRWFATSSYLEGAGRKTPYLSATESEEIARHFAGRDGRTWKTLGSDRQGRVGCAPLAHRTARHPEGKRQGRRDLG